MSKLIENIKRLAAMIKGETKSGGNTAARVGGLFEEIGAELENKYDKTEADQLMIRHNTADDSHLNVQEALIQKINDVREMLLAADQSISQDLATHAGRKSIHKTSEEIRAEIVDADIPETLARVSYVEQEKAAILEIAQEYVTQGIAKVVGGAPDALDALNELAAAINNDPNFAASMMALLNSKAESVHTHTRNQISDFPASMPASDVYPWAKQPDKPSYTAAEVGAATNNHNHAGIYQPAGSYAPATHNHTKSQITDFPASMPASDVYAWAKQPNKPTYNAEEVGAAPVSHEHEIINGNYTGSGGQQPPSYVPGGKVRFNMMNTPVNGDGSYKDFLLMDTYTGVDVPVTTAFGISKSEALRAFIMQGVKGGVAWNRTAEIFTTANFNPDNYATVGHNHNGVYQPAGSYALSNHNHDGTYQPVGNYAPESHNHAASQITEETNKRFMTDAERSKLASIEPEANKYIHPNNSNTRHVTDAEKTKWNNSSPEVYKSQNGYIKLGGIIIQWGDFSYALGSAGNSGGSGKTVYFPTSFPSGCFQVVLNNPGNISFGCGYIGRVKSFTRSSFVYTEDGFASGGAGSYATVRWFAVGY